MSDASWSYSSYSTAMQCLRKYKHIYIDKLQPEQDSGDLKFGSAIHSAVNGALEGEDGEALFSLYWSSYANASLQYGRFKHDALASIGGDFMRKFAKFYIPRLKPVIMEQRAYGEYKGMKVEGTLDFYGELDGVPSLIDWKTTAWNYDKDKTLNALQLHLYAYLCITEHKLIPQQIVYFPFVKSKSSIQEPVILPLDTKRMYALLDDMQRYVNSFAAVGDAKNPNSCLMGMLKCPFFDKCWRDNAGT